MSDKKVKISNILGSQIPDFIQADNPLFKDFLTQYYESQEHEYGATYLSDHIPSFKKISTVSDISLVEKQTVNAPNSASPVSPIILSSLVYAYDDVINVNQTTGFPDKYGLLKIDNEIITYTGKTKTSFTGCIRGFSGISTIETTNNPEFLTFSDTNAAPHAISSPVLNLSFLFITQFYKKFRHNFLPGIEGRSLSYGLNVENILSRARDFYNSKGTDTSLQILFQVLYGEQVEIIKPFDQVIMPSEAEWDVTDDIVVEVISGNPLNLVGIKIYQDSLTNPTASGAVSNVTTKYLGNKKYYQISFSKGTINDTFKVSTKTKVVGTASTTEVLTVDSTIGFGATGNFYYPNADNIYTLAEYTSKSSNQFFGCTGISELLTESEPIIDLNFVYGYEDNDLTKICQMRIVGSISGTSDNVDTTKYFDIGDSIRVKYLGEKYDVSDKKFNTWFYNNLSYVNVQQHQAGQSTFESLTEHFLKTGDRVDIIYKDTNGLIIRDAIVDDVYTPTRFLITGGVSLGSIIFGDYIIRKKLNYASSNFGITSLLSNIQNSFSDTDKNTYVAFSGYPSFDTQTTNRSKTVPSSGISTNASTISISDHGFINGERVYVSISSDSGITGSTSGYFYINVIDNNTFKLTLNPSNLYRNFFEEIKYNGVGTGTHTITPANLYDGQKLINQNNFKRIYKNPQISKSNSNISGPIGVSLNGIEYHSPISEDSVFYGQIDNLEVLNSGKDFNVVNPPTISITDDSGSGCEAYANFSGSLIEILVNDGGFDYSEVPSVSIVGGNGTGAICEAKMKGFIHSKTFTEFDLNLTNDTIVGEHKFSDGEEVTYIATGTPVGINTGINVGFTTDKLTSGSNYFISKVDNNSFKLAITKNRALTKTNLLELIDDGTRTHTFRSNKVRQIVDKIIVNESGSSYSNSRVLVSSQQYPPNNKKDLFKTFVGINTFNNYIYAKNHNFNNGDVIEYSTSDNVISGLDQSTAYKVTVIDSDKFKLSNAGTATTISNTNYDRKIYVNLSSIGVGTHTFKYPDIEVKISGKVSVGTTTVIPDYYKPSAKVIVKGGLKNIFIRNGGVGYGVTNIVNYLRKPTIKLLTGKDGLILPIISEGKITDVSIINSGSEYTTPPELEVVGVGGTSGTNGRFAKLESVVSDGKIVSVNVISGGTGYDTNNTTININPTGSEAIIGADIHDWKVNSVERYNHVLTDNNSELVQIRSISLTNNNKICSFYPVKRYRRLLRDNIDSSFIESSDNHSKIVGWAYDGNPIYGPVGENSSGITTFMQSSYELDVIPDTSLRPLYQNGYFVQDYVYRESGDLDEHNGKFIQNIDFPNGTYAYFSTIDNTTKNPSFPYITFFHRNATDTFNYDISKIQTDSILNTGDYKRNVTHLGLNDEFRNYPLLEDSLNSKSLIKVDGINSSTIDSVSVNEPGTGYKVNDKINFNDLTISASVDQIVGKHIVSIGTTNTIVDNLKFSILNGKVTGVSTIPHGLSNGDIVEISGISSTNYKNIEGIRTIGLTTTTSGLSEAMADTNTTGITTFITFSDPTVNRKFEVNDVVQIDSEQFLVINHDDVNNKYRLRREYNSTTDSSHSAGSLITKLETEFTYSVPKRVENKNLELPKVKYFEAASAIGIGSTTTNVVVGFAGSTSINKSIPPKGIYLPNHPFRNGDEVKLVSVGCTIIGSNNADLSSQFDLVTVDKFYCVKLNNEFIGLSSVNTPGFTTSHLFFRSVTTTAGDDNKIEAIINNISGSLRRVNGTVTVAAATTIGQQHGLSLNDEFELHVTSNKTQTFDLRYNENIRKLVINPVSFGSTNIGVGTTVSTITISDHNFETGDLIVYNSSTPATPLVDNGVYYVVKDSRDTIRLSENSYDLSVFPYNYIGIGTSGGTNHEISKINPKLSLYKNNTIEFLTSDSSLDDFDIEFYEDINFKSKYSSDLITKTDTKTTVSVASSLASEFYYKVEGKNTNTIKTLSFSVDERVSDYSKLVVVDSEFNKSFKVVGIGSSTFKFNPTGIAEASSYTSTGLSSAFYSTKSLGETGGMHSINVLNKGFNVEKLPIITSIGTTNGKNAVLTVEANNVGSVNDTQVFDQGLEFSPDHTLKPKADSNVILELKNIFTLKNIGIATGGVNYTSPPQVIAIGKPDIVAQTTINGSSVNNIKILTNDSGLSEDLRVIPINNSNGIVVTQAVTNSDKTVTLSLRAPQPESGSGSGFFNQGGSFPFQTGDEIFVENIKTIDGNDGYNSSAYDYNYFTVGVTSETGGGESITYSLVGFGTTGGTYKQENNFGRVIKKSDLAQFTPEFEKTTFLENEIVKVPDKNISGIVAEKGWDSLSQTLKVYSVTGDFSKEDSIVGSVSNNKATVTNQFKFDFDLNVNATANILNNWKTDVGKLNLDIQRIHDNDYYQRFSYSVKGDVPFETWKDAVNSLDHVAGFKNFCNLGISSSSTQTLKSDSEVNLEIDIDQEASVHERYYYDLVSEDTEDPDFSKLVVFKSKIITDYNESVTNKVFLLDDISSQFTGIVTSTGGGIIGKSSFDVSTDGNSLFHREFNPSTGVSTSNHDITITRHNFNTGEELIYKPHSGESAIGIANTDVPGIGVTNLLPSTVFAILKDADTIGIAVSASYANAGIAVSFTNAVGIGTTNTLSVPPDNASIRTLISIDNIIQSPVGVNTAISVGLSSEVGISTNIIFLNDTKEISGKSLIKIEDEIIKVDIVGIGTTTLNVIRGQMGTVAAAHTVGAAVTIAKGDYRINEGKLYFSDAPFGLTGNAGIKTSSIFNGRAYYRKSYTTNKIIDDISDRFDGSTDKFNLTTNNTQLTGINTSFGVVLINNIFQRPFYPLGNITKSDYEIVGTGQTIDFTGTTANNDLPRGGIINEFDVGIGSGYQVPRKALFSTVVSTAGTIQSVGILTGGSGYLSPPLVSIAATDRHFTHVFMSSNANSVNVTGGSQLTPTGATYISETGLLTLTLANHGLTTANTITLDNNSLIFRCSRDNFASDHPYPRATDPASGQTLEIMAFTTNTITLDVGVGGGVDAIITASVTAGVVTAVTITNPGTGYTNTGISTGLNFVTASLPSPYKNMSLDNLTGSNQGSGAKVDVVVGTGGSIVSFDMVDRGIGYEIGDVLELNALPFQVGVATTTFKVTVKNKFQDKFAGWCFGQLLELDDFSEQFNGFRKSFLITRTETNKEYYSIVAQPGSGVILQNNFLIFINDVLQKPDRDYEFGGGTRISFKEAPKAGSKFKMYFYTGSSDDFIAVNVDETIKPGDELKLQHYDDTTEQVNRVIYELIAADTVETTTYAGVGIVTDSNFTRPTMWRKQTNDMIIDGIRISKERNYLEPQIYPTSGIIKSISPTDSKIYIKDSWLFEGVDNVTGTKNVINIVGLGTTAVVEKIEGATYSGDYGIIVGVGTSASGINTTGPAIFFEIKPDPTIYSASPEGTQITRSGITTGDYFVINNTFIGDGITGIKTTSSGPETVGVGNSFLDNVYFAEHHVSVGSSITRVFANVNSITGINTAGLSTHFKSGTYSWGSINVSRGSNSKPFTFYNQNGVLGIETSAQVIRTLAVQSEYSD